MLNSSTCSDFTTTGLLNLIYLTMQTPYNSALWDYTFAIVSEAIFP